jgi:hypothetical protein
MSQVDREGSEIIWGIELGISALSPRAKAPG